MSWQFASGVAATLLLVVLTIAFTNSRGVQGFFGIPGGGNVDTQEVRPSVPPPAVKNEVTIEWRNVDGTSLPVLVAGVATPERSTLAWSASAYDTNETAQMLWQGDLQPGTRLEMPLGWAVRMPMSKSNAFVLWWNTSNKARVFLVPVNYPALKIASIRLQQPLSEALQNIAAQYQTVIEWQPVDQNNPYVVLDVKDAAIEETLNKLLEGTPYVARVEGERWVVGVP